MEKHSCKLCFKNFSNGRALGGHMRSHMLNLPIPPRHEEEEEERPTEPNQLSDGDTESGSLSSSSSDEEGEEGGGGEKGNLCYGLRENPKRSFRLVDPEFSFAAAAAAAVDAGSVVLQDRESETESSKNPTRRRSKRTRKLDHHHHQFDHHHQFHHHHQYHHQHQQQQQQQQENGTKKLKFHKLSKTTESSSWAHEPEPVSSISDTTTEEDVAFCLMMLSRDKWKRKEQLQQKQQQRRRQVFVVDQEEEEEEAEAEAEKSMEETDESDEFIKSCKNRSRVGKYKCDTCKKVFKSYQALGGHRASHKKIKFYNTTTATQTTKQTESEQQENAGTSIATPMLEKANKVHECPVCFRVFSSGQALGGHKRTHVTGLVAATTTSTTPARTQHHQRHVTSSSTKFGDNLIDLNLPAPVDDDDISQIELSAVSDAEFVNHIKR